MRAVCGLCARQSRAGTRQCCTSADRPDRTCEEHAPIRVAHDALVFYVCVHGRSCSVRQAQRLAGLAKLLSQIVVHARLRSRASAGLSLIQADPSRARHCLE